MATVLCVQTHPTFGDVAANLQAVERLLADHASADLVVLPELFATGYAFRDADEALALAERFPDGDTVQRMRSWSQRLGGVVVGGFPERDGDRVYNAAAVVADGAALRSYRKVHLFGFEPEVFAQGQEVFPVVDHRGLRVGVMVCFDWIHPEVARSLALDGADVIAHPANLVLPWCQRAMPVRALENGVFTVTANRVGEEDRPPRPALRFTGASTVASPSGEVLAQACPDTPEVLSVTIDPTRARNKRLTSGNDRFAERRPDLYGALVRRPQAR
jgi:predicted amidohydrolase